MRDLTIRELEICYWAINELLDRADPDPEENCCLAGVLDGPATVEELAQLIHVIVGALRFQGHPSQGDV